MALALRDCPADRRAALVRALLDLSRSPAADLALGIAARTYSTLAAPDQASLAAAPRQGWSLPARFGLAGATAAERASIAEWLAHSDDPDVPSILGALLADEPAVAASAGQSLIVLAARAAAFGSWALCGELSHALAVAAEGFDAHRRREALLAVLVLLSAPGGLSALPAPLRAIFADSDHPAILGFRSVLRRDEHPLLDVAALALLTFDALRAAAAQRLALRPGPLPADALLTRAHLLLHPQRAAALRTGPLRSPLPASLPAESAVRALSPLSARALPRWLGASALPDAAFVRALEPMLLHPDPGARHAAMLAAAGFAPDLALDFSFDPDPDVARSALLHAAPGAAAHSAHAEPVLRAARGLQDSPDARVQGIAEELVRRLDRDDLTTIAARMDLRRLAARDRSAAALRLQRALREGPLAQRLACVRLARDLDLAPDLELEILSLLAVTGRERPPAHTSPAGDDARVAAASIPLLARIPTSAAAHTLRRCLHHADNRIRAAAVDALAAHAFEHPDGRAPLDQALIELKSDAHHRVRSAAIRAGLIADLTPGRTLSGSTLAPALAPMLTDIHPMHRAAGLWLAGRVLPLCDPATVDALAPVIAPLVRDDPDSAVRDRAAGVARRLVTITRSAWADRATSV